MAIIRTRVVSVSEEGLTGKTLKNIVGIIVGDAVIVIVLAADTLLLAEAIEGHFSLKVAENIGENFSKRGSNKGAN